MDRFYDGLEASLLAFGFALGLSVILLSSLPKPDPSFAIASVTLPEISVSPND